MMTKYFLSLFYFLLTLMFIRKVAPFVDVPKTENLIWFGYFFSGVSQESMVSIVYGTYFAGISVSLLSALLVLVPKPGKYISLTVVACRSLVPIFYITWVSLQYSYGKINNDQHPWMFAAIFFSFIGTSKSLASRRNRFFLRLTQSVLLTSYFIAGIWKMRELVQLNGIGDVQKEVLNSFAYAIAEGSIRLDSFREWFLLEHKGILVLGMLLVLVFELSVILPVILDRYYWAFGIFAILFHLNNGLFLGIPFVPTIYALALIVVLGDILLGLSERQANVQLPAP